MGVSRGNRKVGTWSALVNIRNDGTYRVTLSLGCGETVETMVVVGGSEWGRSWSGRKWARVGASGCE